jgi:ribosomal protein L24
MNKELNECEGDHNYVIAGKETSKNGDLVQVIYCTKCADHKEIVIKERVNVKSCINIY